MIQSGGELVVEIYPLELRLSAYPNLKDIKKRMLSRADTVGE